MTNIAANNVVATRQVLMSTDYEQFKTLGGNREVNPSHVKQLQKLMIDNGNLTAEFPIVIDREGFVIDGQHRLEALKGLGWEVGYMVEENATIDTVRAINRGNRNWGWRDIAYSHANLGNEDYRWFISFVDQYGLKFGPALTIVGGKQTKGGAGRGFSSGDLKIADKAKAHDSARQMVEIQRLVQIYNGDFSHALISVMRSPAYNHERMMHKLRQQGEILPEKSRISDYMRLLEDMYNFGFTDDNRQRLF